MIKIIDSGHQDSQYLATLTFDATAGAAQDECPASPSPTVVGWMATRMAATPTTVARWMPVPIAVPLAAVGAREEVAPHCVTDLGPRRLRLLQWSKTCAYLFSRPFDILTEQVWPGTLSHHGRVCRGHKSLSERMSAVLEIRYAQVSATRERRKRRLCYTSCLTWA